jgi:hypothetical protein
VASYGYSVYSNLNGSLERCVGLPQTTGLDNIDTVLGNDRLIIRISSEEATLIELFRIKDTCRRRAGED